MTPHSKERQHEIEDSLQIRWTKKQNAEFLEWVWSIMNTRKVEDVELV